MTNAIEPCAVVTVPDPAQAAAWLEENLFFRRLAPDTVANGTCVLRLRQGLAQTAAAGAGQYLTGPAHIALRTADIDAAQKHCQSAGLQLSLEEGHSFFNPKVFGAGERYFNIAAPFGVTVEISQRVAAPHYGERMLIDGLDHIGLPCADLRRRMDALQSAGFAPEFEPVHNYNDREGNIHCCMLRRDGVTLEVYQFDDMTPVPMPDGAALALPGIPL